MRRFASGDGHGVGDGVFPVLSVVEEGGGDFDCDDDFLFPFSVPVVTVLDLGFSETSFLSVSDWDPEPEDETTGTKRPQTPLTTDKNSA